MTIDFKIGDTLNFSWSGFFGNVIKFHNWLQYRNTHPEAIKYTHTAIVTNIEGDYIEIFEALSTGAEFRKFHVDELTAYVRQGHLAIGRSHKQLTNVRKNAMRYHQRPYGKVKTFLAIAGYAIFGKIATRVSDTAQENICSELTARVLYDSSNKTINFEKEFAKPYHLITPADVRVSKQFTWEE